MKVKSSKHQSNSDLLVKVLFFKPAMPLDANTLTASYGVTAGPLLDAAFYVELGARAVETVERMKSNFFFEFLHMTLRSDLPWTENKIK